MITALSRVVGQPARGAALVEELRRGLEQIAASAALLAYRPRVFFEEWKDPLISGIGWVEELVEIAGGQVLFPELKKCGKSKDRIVEPDEVAARNPDVIIASWCGMKVNQRHICSRPGWQATNAVRNGHVYEVKSSYILQPGPASLTEGVRQIQGILSRVAGQY
jgi:iron complex transport system substrate-binding protein